MDDLSPEQRERMENAVMSVLARLRKAGWAEAGDIAGGISWTERGRERSQQLRVLFKELGDFITGDELEAFLHLFMMFPPIPPHSTN